MYLKKSKNYSILIAAPLLFSLQAHSIEYYTAGIETKIDSQISIGSSWRVEGQSKKLLQGLDSTTRTINQENRNDGDINAKEGAAFSQVIKGSHDLQISYENVGLFARGKYWYDHALENNSNLDDSDNHELAKYSGAALLDAFIYGEFDFFGQALDVRLGNQVVSWGESTFIRDGINQINPVDVPAIRRPGAELKEALIPVNMFFAGISLTDNLSSEFFYQLGFEESVIDDCGTYFSTSDFTAQGCTTLSTTVGTLSRVSDKKPKSDGQLGLAFRYFSETLDTEFGIYGMNIHSRTPTVSGVKASFNELALYDTLQASGAFQSSANLLTSGNPSDQSQYDLLTGTALTAVNAQAAIGTMAGLSTNSVLATPFSGAITPLQYQVGFIEDQRILGLSFATNVGGIALSGEVSHKQDVPFQIDSIQLIGAAILSDATYTHVYKETLASPLAAIAATNLGISVEALADSAAKKQVKENHGEFGLEVLGSADGGTISGSKQYDVSQVQVTAIKTMDRFLGASSIMAIAEVGYRYAHGLDENDFTIFGNVLDPVTQSAWGYRTRVSGQYNNVFSGVNLIPTLMLSHDVEGVNGQFHEGQYSTDMQLRADYLNTYSAEIAFTMYDGGQHNELSDRDFVSLNASMQF